MAKKNTEIVCPCKDIVEGVLVTLKKLVDGILLQLDLLGKKCDTLLSRLPPMLPPSFPPSLPNPPNIPKAPKRDDLEQLRTEMNVELDRVKKLNQEYEKKCRDGKKVSDESLNSQFTI